MADDLTIVAGVLQRDGVPIIKAKEVSSVAAAMRTALGVPSDADFASLTEADSRFEYLIPNGKLSVLQEASFRTVRIFHIGTSIQASSFSGSKQWLESLVKHYGDAGNFSPYLTFLGGSVSPYNGWYKQPYGGVAFDRLRGDSSSTALIWRRRCRQVIVRYSTEANGGSFDIEADGAVIGTINSLGSQSYNNEFVYAFTDNKFRTITIKPPASGYAYFEAVELNQNNPGIHVIDGTLGGTAVKSMLVYPAPTGGEVAPIQPTSTYRGFDSYLLATSATAKHDVIVSGQLVNDANSGLAYMQTDYKAAQDRLIAQSKINGTQIVMNVEPAGHYAVPGDPNHSAYAYGRNLLLSYATEPHVTVIDHHEMTSPPPDTGTLGEWNEWASRIYDTAVITSLSPFSYTGDFIHPTTTAYASFSAKASQLSGVPPTGRIGSLVDAVASTRKYNRVPRIGNIQGASLESMSPAIPRSLPDTYGTLVPVMSAGESQWLFGLPEALTTLYSSDVIPNLAATANASIEAETTKDVWGKYRASSGGWAIGGIAVPSGKLVTVVAVMNSASAMVMKARNSANTVTLEAYAEGISLGAGTADSGIGLNAIPGDRPLVVHMTVMTTGANMLVGLTADKVYALFVTPTDFPVLAPYSLTQIAARQFDESYLIAGKTNIVDLALDAVYTNTGTPGNAATITQQAHVLWGTGATANSTFRAAVPTVMSNTNTGSNSTGSFDWTKPLSFTVHLFNQPNENSANGIFRAVTKKTTFGALSARGVGFEIRQLRLWLTVHDGTTLTDTDTGLTIATNQVYAITVTSHGDGRVSIFSRGVLLLTIPSGGPSTLGSNDNGFAIECTNGADAASNRWQIMRRIPIVGG